MTTTTEIPNRFDFAAATDRIYQMWVDGGYFHAEPDSDKQPFTIVIPPPNVTGALHLGHALNNTLQDILIRMKRMQGFNTLWMPGTDHAGIATQARVEKRLKEEEGKTRHDLGRENLVARIWEWKDQYESRILGQLKQMGCSCDWERTRFTLDDICARAVRHFFYDLFQKQFIFRGKRLVNWDTYLQTAVSDDEVFSKSVKGNFWHLKYPVIDPKPGEPEFVIVATTRPETMLGDTAVAVHPDPARALDKAKLELEEKLAKSSESEKEALQSQLQDLETRRAEMLPSLELLRDMANDGRKIRLPLLDREMPMVIDTWAKPELGSGCVKITPAHDPNDYEVGKRAGLEMINVMNPNGTMNVEAGPYESLTLKECRKKVVADLDELGLLDQTEEREIELPHSDRSKTPIEPYLADQWFVRMEELAQSAIDAVDDGRVKIFPTRYAKGYVDWLSEKRDWPVSRQLWWGHQIPVWSMPCDDAEIEQEFMDKIKALPAFDTSSSSIQIEPCSEPDEAKRKKLELPYSTIHVCIRDEGAELESQLEAIGLVRQQDVLDTWFSSALWPHSTLGWPDKTAELDYFYKTSTLITSRDIITLWVARMVLAGLNNMGEVPFDEVFIHPKILDGYGETMSKTKGNGIDPIDVINKFGPDALRYSMCHLTTDTQDVRMPIQFECPHCNEKIDQTKKNRELPVVECIHCKKSFSTQWAEKPDEIALPRGASVSERFENGRNFTNKLWNASRFAMMNLDGYSAEPIDEAQLLLEDRWILSRLATVSKNATQALEQYHYGEAVRLLYEFAWDDFCSFYVEILKDRFAGEGRAVAQRLMAFTLDAILRLLHPIMPFVTEEIWQLLGQFAPERGFGETEAAAKSLMIASWPNLPDKWIDAEIESQFKQFQLALTALRDIRARQNVDRNTEVDFVVRCDAVTVKMLEPMKPYFASMGKGNLTEIGDQPEIPKINATVPVGAVEIFVDLNGLIDVSAEIARLEKEETRLQGMIAGSEKKLSNASFVDRAPADVVEKVRETLASNKEQLSATQNAITELQQMN